jgi:hypothetical protein
LFLEAGDESDGADEFSLGGIPAEIEFADADDEVAGGECDEEIDELIGAGWVEADGEVLFFEEAGGFVAGDACGGVDGAGFDAASFGLHDDARDEEGGLFFGEDAGALAFEFLESEGIFVGFSEFVLEGEEGLAVTLDGGLDAGVVVEVRPDEPEVEDDEEDGGGDDDEAPFLGAEVQGIEEAGHSGLEWWRSAVKFQAYLAPG